MNGDYAQRTVSFLKCRRMGAQSDLAWLDRQIEKEPPGPVLERQIALRLALSRVVWALEDAEGAADWLQGEVDCQEGL